VSCELASSFYRHLKAVDSIFIIVDSLVPTKIFKVDTILSKAYEHHVIYNISQKKKIQIKNEL
jgi:hypothetical protein